MFKSLLRTIPSVSGNFTLACRLNDIAKRTDKEYTAYINSFETSCKIEKVLPLDKEPLQSDNIDNIEPLFDPSPSTVLDLIVPHYLDALLYRYFLESALSEQTCRKNSMENASTSADKLIENLKLLYNKVRQQNITNEITEIVSGSNTHDPIDFI